MFRSIIPREEMFFDSFEGICILIVEAAKKLKAMFDKGSPFDAAAREIKTLESEADEQVHQAAKKLHKTFVTPFDRQDIHKLTLRLDDILDMIEAVSSRLELFDPQRVMEETREMSRVLVEGTEQVAAMIGLLRDFKKQSGRILELTVEINRLENEADQIHHKAVARLFRVEDDARELIKWKEILDHIEEATDRCEDIADIVEGIVLENI